MVPYNTPAFSSGYASLLYGFVESKRLEGCKYNGEVKELQRLDRYFRTHGVTPADHPEKTVYGWLGKRCAAGPSQCKGKTERERFHPVYFHA